VGITLTNINEANDEMGGKIHFENICYYSARNLSSCPLSES
jgi:hypothetical protein